MDCVKVLVTALIGGVAGWLVRGSGFETISLP
jgi:hypothetical protein